MGPHSGTLSNQGQKLCSYPYQFSSVSPLLPRRQKCPLSFAVSSHKKGILDILSLPDAPTTTKAQVAAALVQWEALEFESVAISRGMCVSAYRTFEEWDKHPHAKMLINQLPISVMRTSDALKRTITKNDTNPLGQIRVLDLSRVLAGPVAGRALAGES